jgi:hypothetical protein
MEQYLRKASLTVGEKVFGVRLQFTVEKDTAGMVANKSTIKAFNLSQASRDYIEQKDSSGPKRVTLAVGYEEGQSVLFYGDIYYAFTERNGADILTNIVLGSGMAWAQSATIGISGALTDLQVWERIKQTLVGYGLAAGFIDNATLASFAAGSYPRGFHYEGTVKGLLVILTSRYDLNWSVDNGALHIYRGDRYQDGAEILLSKDTGMLGFPSKVRDQEFKVKALLNPQIVPGKKVVVESSSLKQPAEMRVLKVIHQGDSLEGDWYSEFEAQTINTNPILLEANRE